MMMMVFVVFLVAYQVPIVNKGFSPPEPSLPDTHIVHEVAVLISFYPLYCQNVLYRLLLLSKVLPGLLGVFLLTCWAASLVRASPVQASPVRAFLVLASPDLAYQRHPLVGDHVSTDTKPGIRSDLLGVPSPARPCLRDVGRITVVPYQLLMVLLVVL